MIPVTPVLIPEPFAEDGTKNVIPAQSPGATEPNASWNTGFPPITMLNRQAGGKPPLGADFNGVLNALSQHAFFTQSGCVFPWQGASEEFPGLNYLVGAHVLGSDMKEYTAVQPSGPDIPASGGGYVGPQDPVKDTEHLYWRPEVTSADIPEFDGVTIREINGKYGVPEFTAPTASAPGKAGLVPGPGASGFPQNVILTADQFQEVDLAFMHPTAESAELNKTRVDMGGVTAEGVNIDTLLRSGIFTATAFSGTLPSGVRGGVLYNIMSMGVTASSPTYYGIQILFTWGGKIYLRTNRGGIAPGGAVSWTEWGAVGSTSNGQAGDIIMSGAASRTGALLCNGAWISRTTYAGLFAAIGTTFGAGDGATTFALPNFTDRWPVGAGSIAARGAYVGQGLPNIWGNLYTRAILAADGVFSVNGGNIGPENGNLGGTPKRIFFNAEALNSIYGASANVTPLSLGINFFIVY